MSTWHDPALSAAVDALDDPDAPGLTAARAVLAEARTEPEVRSLRTEVLAERLVGSGRGLIGRAMDTVDAELSLLAGAVAVREARVIAEGSRDPDAARMTHAYLRRAVGPLNQAAELVAADPVPHDLLQYAAAVLNPAEREDAWQQAVKRAPRLFSAHRTRIDLLPDEQAIAFARDTARAAGSGDPRIALVAYAHLRAGARLASRRAYFGPAGGPVRGEIADLAARFLAAARPHPRTPQAHALFAAAFAAMASPDLAAPHLAAARRPAPSFDPPRP